MRPIEYVGAAPMKKKRRSSLGGLLLVAFALTVGGFFVYPLIPYLRAQDGLTSNENVLKAMNSLRSNGDSGSLLAVAALKRTQFDVNYDGSYYKIDFPNGDVRSDRGQAEDVIVRAYRDLNVDLQLELHEDISANFRSYPQVFGQKEADTNIDHRRVKNLQRFFSRNGESLPVTDQEADYEFGDVVVWRLLGGSKHIGIVVPGPGDLSEERWVVHHMRSGPVWEKGLFDYPIDGRYRYDGPAKSEESE